MGKRLDRMKTFQRVEVVLTVALAMLQAQAIASPITFANPGFETGDFSGWTTSNVVLGTSPATQGDVTSFDTVAGIVSLAATAPPSSGAAYNLELFQTFTTSTPLYFHVYADVAVVDGRAGFAPRFNGGTFGNSQPTLSTANTLRDFVEGTIYVLGGTNTIGFSILEYSGTAYLDNAYLVATVDPPQGQIDCGGPPPDGGAFGCNIPRPSAPEPATLALLGIGLAGLGFSRRKQ